VKDLILQVWTWLSPAHEFIVSVAIALATAFLIWLFRAKVKLLWGSTSTSYHTFRLGENGQNIAIWTEKFYVQNTGRKPASSIEIVFSDSLTSFNLWPPRDHSQKTLDNGNYVIAVPSLAPGELLIVDMIDIDLRSPKLLSVNCPDSLSRQVDFVAQRQFGRVVTTVVAYLMISGAVGTIYLLIRLLAR
jgi:hypothetical protein